MSCLFGFVLRETTESWTQMNESTTPIIFIGALLASIFILYVILVVRFLLKSSPKSTETSDKKPDGASPKGFPYLASPLSPLGMENLLMHRCVPVQPRSYEELVRVKQKGALGASTGAQSLVLMEDMQLSFFPWFCSSFSISPDVFSLQPGFCFFWPMFSYFLLLSCTCCPCFTKALILHLLLLTSLFFSLSQLFMFCLGISITVFVPLGTQGVQTR